MVKIASSAAIKESIPTCPREGSFHTNSIGGVSGDLLFRRIA
jgi:hypothetical protein